MAEREREFRRKEEEREGRRGREAFVCFARARRLLCAPCLGSRLSPRPSLSPLREPSACLSSSIAGCTRAYWRGGAGRGLRAEGRERRRWRLATARAAPAGCQWMFPAWPPLRRGAAASRDAREEAHEERRIRRASASARRGGGAPPGPQRSARASQSRRPYGRTRPRPCAAAHMRPHTQPLPPAPPPPHGSTVSPGRAGPGGSASTRTRDPPWVGGNEYSRTL